jgi:hypothetical protein
MSESNKGGQPGNQNAHIGSLVKGAIRRVLHENEAAGRESLVNIVRKLVDKAELDGDLPATKELFDRIEGKAAQSVAVTGQDGGPVKVEKIVREVVRANP